MSLNSPIGLFDSGLGGLSVLRALRRELPHERFIYLGDTARTPYGTKSPTTIERYALECAHFLLRQNVKAVIIACNTATAHAATRLQTECPCPVVGAIQPAVETALAESPERIIVIGTPATIGSGAYERAIRHLSPMIPIVSLPCPLFVPLVETGEWNGPLVQHVIRHSFRSVEIRPGDTLILGCTHFVFLEDAIREVLGSQIRIVDSARPIAQMTARILTAGLLLRRGRSHRENDEFFVTDEVSRFNALGSLFLEDMAMQSVAVEDLSIAA